MKKIKATEKKIQEPWGRLSIQHPERATAEASYDADLTFRAELGPGENEPEGTREPGRPEDGGAGVVRADAWRRAARHPRPYTGTEKATDEPTFSRVHRNAYQVSVRSGERLLPEDLVLGTAGPLSNSIWRGDQAGPYPQFCGAATDTQTEPDAGPEEPISYHHWRGTPTKYGDRQMSSWRRPGSQPGTVARHEVGLRSSAASLLQGVRPVRAVWADR